MISVVELIQSKSGEMIRVCMNSDFFLEEADPWRDEAWAIIRQRPDVKFWLLTKRPERVSACLPYDWGDGWENVMFNVTCENQRRADERIPILLDLPFKHKGNEKISIQLTSEELGVLVGRIYEYTIKLAKDNDVDLKEEELNTADMKNAGTFINLQNYLKAQKRIFEAAA